MVRISPIRITGEWLYGYALDYHTTASEYVDGGATANFNSTRSEMGDLLYNLKYKSDSSVIDTISETICAFVTEQRWQPDAVIPVPPSSVSRSFQPVIRLAECIAELLGIECYADCVEKITETPELKNIDSRKERIRHLQDAFEVHNSSVVADRNILIFDDLYRSGATLNSIARVLHQNGNVKQIFALTLTKTRSKR